MFKLQGIYEESMNEWEEMVSLKDKKGFYIPSVDFIYSFTGAVHLFSAVSRVVVPN